MRTIRRNVPGVVYHLIWRFIDRRFFIRSWRERNVYLGLLGRALADSDWKCFAYALMSNHVHLAMLAGREPLSAWSRRVNSPFASWMNEHVQRIGPVFAQAPRDYAIMPAREANLLAYIHRNPVRAGLVARAADSSWTSHRVYVGRAKHHPWLHHEEALERIGMDAREFARWVQTDEGDSGESSVDSMQRALRRRGGLRAATPSVGAVPIVGRPSSYWRPDPRAVIRIACELGGVPWALVCSRRLLPNAMTARRAIIHAGAERGLSFSELADALGISQQGVSKMARRRLSGDELALLGAIRERLELQQSSESGIRPSRR